MSLQRVVDTEFRKRTTKGWQDVESNCELLRTVNKMVKKNPNNARGDGS